MEKLGSGMEKSLIRDKHPGSATLLKAHDPGSGSAKLNVNIAKES
jgi:hypothetical protein